MQSVTDQEQKFSVNPAWNTRFKSYVFAEDISPELRKIFMDAEALLAHSRVVKNSRSTSAGVFRVNDTDYFIKRSNVKNFSERLRRVGRMPRAMRNWFITGELKKANILVPEIYMALATSPGLLPGASYLITECFPLPMTVSNNLPSLLEESGSTEKLLRRICSIAAVIHERGIEHGDLKLNNILNTGTPEQGFKLGLFDFDGSVKYAKSCSNAVRMRELARMASSYFIRCCELDMAVDWQKNLADWAAAYAACSSFDYSKAREYLDRARRFLPNGLQDRIN